MEHFFLPGSDNVVSLDMPSHIAVVASSGCERGSRPLALHPRTIQGSSKELFRGLSLERILNDTTGVKRKTDAVPRAL